MAKLDLARLVDDRLADGIFRIHRDVYKDEAIFQAEMARIFEATWVYIGLESQVPKPNDFVTTHIGRQPVILQRDQHGTLRCFLNTCRHRGAIVCPFAKGSTKYHVCRYHGWSWENTGRNFSITDKDAAGYPGSFEAQDHDLLQVARLASYRGLVFASLSPDVPSLEEHLGEARWFIDLMVDQGEHGLEYVPGSVHYTYEGNWKLQFENGLDSYHFGPTHASYVDVLNRRAQDHPTPWKPEHEPDAEGQGSFSFGRGHAVMWSIRSPARGVRPLNADPERRADILRRVGPVKLKWMLRQRNLTIWPNLQLIDITSSQLRTWRPLSPTRTEMASHCIAPIGEAAEPRRFRIRQYEDFFNTTGLATSDDNVMYEFCQEGYRAAGGYTQGWYRGMASNRAPALALAEEAGFRPEGWSFGPLALGDETCFHAGYREWRRALKGA